MVVATAAMVALPEPVMAALPGPTVHGMETPPQGRALPASPIGTPPVVIEPGVGCSLEELRVWVIQKFGHVNRDATELEVRAGARINQVAFAAEETSLRLAAAEPIVRASAAALNDVGVFGNIKNFVTEQALQTRFDAFDLEIKKLQAKGNEFTTHLDAHLIQLNGVEVAFKGHVADGFANVEKELKHMQVVFNGAQAGTSGNEAVAGVTLQFQHLKAGVEAEFVGLKSELEAQRAATGALHDHAATVAKAKCHCVHLDELAARIQNFERELAVMAAAKPAAGASAGPGIYSWHSRPLGRFHKRSRDSSSC